MCGSVKNAKFATGQMAPSELSGQELLSYYKARVGRRCFDQSISFSLIITNYPSDDFEAERSALLESVEKCSVQAAELHRLDWENRRRADEIRELQKASHCLGLPPCPPYHHLGRTAWPGFGRPLPCSVLTGLTLLGCWGAGAERRSRLPV